MRLVDPVLIAQAIEHLKTDIYADTYEEIVNINSKPPAISISNTNIQTRSYSRVEKNIHQFRTVAQDTGKYEQVGRYGHYLRVYDRVSVRNDKDSTDLCESAAPGSYELEEGPWCLKDPWAEQRICSK